MDRPSASCPGRAPRPTVAPHAPASRTSPPAPRAGRTSAAPRGCREGAAFSYRTRSAPTSTATRYKLRSALRSVNSTRRRSMGRVVSTETHEPLCILRYVPCRCSTTRSDYAINEYYLANNRVAVLCKV